MIKCAVMLLVLFSFQSPALCSDFISSHKFVKGFSYGTAVTMFSLACKASCSETLTISVGGGTISFLMGRWISDSDKIQSDKSNNSSSDNDKKRKSDISGIFGFILAPVFFKLLNFF